MADGPDKESKTQEATEKRLRDALDEGNVPVSKEAGNFAFIVASMLAIGMLAPWALGRLGSDLTELLATVGERRILDTNDAVALYVSMAERTFLPLWSFPLLFAIAGISASLIANEPVVALKRVAPQFSRVSPLGGLKRLMSSQGLLEFVKTCLRFFFLASCAVYAALAVRGDVEASMWKGAGEILTTAQSAAGKILTGVAVPYLALLVFDLPLVRLLWRRSLRMTHDEIKQERKQSEGDAHVKARRRSIARSRQRRRMPADVRKATLVIANPTHFAVALRYVPSEGGAPRVVAKGQDRIALAIRQIAEDEGIPVVEDKALARSLYKKVSVDQMIPVEFYRVIAEILIKLKRSGSTSPARGPTVRSN